MNAVRQFRQMLFSRAPSPPRSVRTFGFLHLDSATKIEEERCQPTKEIFTTRFGSATCTIPDTKFCLNWVLEPIPRCGFVETFGASTQISLKSQLIAFRDHRYVALKVYIYSSKSNREVEVLRHLSNINPESHPGRSVIRTMLDNFEINGS